MQRPYLNSAQIAIKLANGQPVFVEYLVNLMYGTLHTTVGPLLFARDFRQALLAGVSASAAMQVMVVTYTGLNYQNFYKKDTGRRYEPLLPSAKAAESYFEDNSKVGGLVKTVLGRLPFLSAGYMAAGMPLLSGLGAALVSSLYIEYVVLDYMRNRWLENQLPRLA